MEGRLENEQKINEKICNHLYNRPSFLQGWMNYLEANDITASSRFDFLYKALNYIDYIGLEHNTEICTLITPQSLTKYFIKIKIKQDENGKQDETSVSYRQGVYYALRNMCIYLNENGWLNISFDSIIKKPKKKNVTNKQRDMLTESDFKAILSAAKDTTDYVSRERDIAILTIFMMTGMRKTALTSINIGDVDFDSNILRVIDKEGTTHNYALNQTMKNSLNDWLVVREKCLKNKRSTDALFISRLGTRISNSMVREIVGKYTQQALGHTYSPHKLRAGYCSILYEKTGNIEFVRRAVGHSDIKTTQLYIRTDGTERSKAAEMLQNIFE